MRNLIFACVFAVAGCAGGPSLAPVAHTLEAVKAAYLAVCEAPATLPQYEKCAAASVAYDRAVAEYKGVNDGLK